MNRARPCAAIAIVLVFLVAAIPYAAQDFIKAYPELERLMSRGRPSAADIEALNKTLSSMPPAERDKFVKEMIEGGQRIEREGITVETAFMRLRKTPDNPISLTVQSRPSTRAPLTPNELAELTTLPLTGVLDVLQSGSGGVAGATKHVRLRVIMQKPIAAPEEFSLPDEGSLIIVQLDEKWITIPKTYPSSGKTVRIAPTSRGTTSIDYDIGNGRTGSEPYSWNR